MTKFSLLTTASVAVLAMAIASPALAEPNDFANYGDANVEVINNNRGGEGGQGGEGGAADTGAGMALGGAGGNGGEAGEGGAIGSGANDQGPGGPGNVVHANSSNTYDSTEIDVEAENDQNVGYHVENGEWVVNGNGGNSIDTYGDDNEQEGGSASAEADAEVEAEISSETDISGGEAEGGEADVSNSVDTEANGGSVEPVETVSDASSDEASADAEALAIGYNEGVQDATADTGTNTGGDGGHGAATQNDQGVSFGPGSINDNETMGGTALANANGGNTSGPQDANGGDVSSGDTLVDGGGSAAGAFAMNGAAGSFGVGNSANAVAAHVNTINSN